MCGGNPVVRISLAHCLKEELPCASPDSSPSAVGSPTPTNRSLRSLRKQTVIVCDWDDTLFPTTPTLARSELAPPGLDTQRDEHMERAIHYVKDLLEMAQECGFVYIVTNAESGWVEESASLWAPELLPVLKNIPVVSARACFESLLPDDPNEWKVQVFLAIRRQHRATPITNLVSLGDSESEGKAAKIFGEECQVLGHQAFVKTVKFKQRPTFAEHFAQVRAIHSKFEKIVTATRDLEVVLARKKSASW